MKAILITRPVTVSDSLLNALHKNKYQTLHEPLLTIVPTLVPLPDVAVDAMIVTSSNALFVLDSKHSDIQPLLDLPCFCVGTRTSETARQFGFCQVMNADGDGVALASVIKAYYGNKPASLLHICGEHTSASLRQVLGDHTLTAEQKMDPRFRGDDGGGLLQINQWPVYKALAVDDFSPEFLQQLHNQTVDAALFFSPRTASLFVQHIRHHKLEACCQSLTAIGISDAVCKALNVILWHQVAVAAKPTEEAMIEKLLQLCPSS